MTLATTCPHCKTSFRVVADQLKLRRGLVRCGRCHQVFSGVDALTYLDEPATPSTSQPAESQTPLPSSEPGQADLGSAEQEPVVEPVVEPQNSTHGGEPATPGSVDLLPASSTSQSNPRRSVILKLLIAIGLLGVTLQALVGWRHELAYRWPTAMPLFAMLFERVGLDLHPPLDARALTIESFEVVAASEPLKLSLEAVIRNRSDRAVAFPAIELTLRDAQSVLLSRRVVEAQAYVSSEQRPHGLAAGAEWTIQVLLEHDGLAVTGYSAVLFHP